MPFIADNSVIVAWFSRSRATAYTDRQYKRLTDNELIVPSVWPFEFANALAVLERRRILSRTLVNDIVVRAERLPARIDAPPPALSTLLRLARQHGLSAYDAAYLELAQRLQLLLAVKDGPLVKAASASGLLAA